MNYARIFENTHDRVGVFRGAVFVTPDTGARALSGADIVALGEGRAAAIWGTFAKIYCSAPSAIAIDALKARLARACGGITRPVIGTPREAPTSAVVVFAFV